MAIECVQDEAGSYSALEELLTDIYKSLPRWQHDAFGGRIQGALSALKNRKAPAFVMLVNKSGSIIRLQVDGHPLGLVQSFHFSAYAGDYPPQSHGRISLVELPPASVSEQAQEARKVLWDLPWMTVEVIKLINTESEPKK